jgi:hypothetical protein
MTLHLLKLSVGSESVDSLGRWQAQRLAETGRLWHFTRMMPRRRAELLDGGSIYWVIKGVIQARQALTALEPAVDEAGRGFVRLHLCPELIRVVPRAHRPFQGWRYFAAEAAPPDLERAGPGEAELPPELLAELRQLGLL